MHSDFSIFPNFMCLFHVSYTSHKRIATLKIKQNPFQMTFMLNLRTRPLEQDPCIFTDFNNKIKLILSGIQTNILYLNNWYD